ncbi:MAG: tetratricopeptide repeat protein [Desulfovibrio sp.]|nr:tetratricopeptide repeat protein [Desulfovibrio sp.]
MGVYSLKSQQRQLKYFAWRLADGTYAVQELDSAYTAQGPAQHVQAEKFQTLFKQEPLILAAPVVTPDFRQFAPGETSKPEADDKNFAALERARSIRQTEADLRDTFEKALRALARPKDRKGALASLGRIAATRKGIKLEHKHMFRDFGVALRKKALPDLALECASRVVELSPEDDHARFNLARIYGILGRYDDAARQLQEAIRIDPAEKVYERLERHIERERQFAEARKKPVDE